VLEPSCHPHFLSWLGRDIGQGGDLHLLTCYRPNLCDLAGLRFAKAIGDDGWFFHLCGNRTTWAWCLRQLGEALLQVCPSDRRCNQKERFNATVLVETEPVGPLRESVLLILLHRPLSRVRAARKERLRPA